MNDFEETKGSAPDVALLLKQLGTDEPASFGGSAADALAALERDSVLSKEPPTPIEQAYEEFCNRRDNGEVIDLDEYCAAFPAFRSELREQLSVDRVMFRHQDRIPQKGSVVWPELDDAVGEYTVLRELGRGAFARVYLATEASTGDRPVVLKLSLDRTTEAHTLGRLVHEHIVPVLSARQHERGYSMVCMPYLGSATLDHVITRAYPEANSPPPRQARLILDAVRAAAQPDDPVLECGEPAAYLHRGTWVDAVTHLGERLAVALAYVHGHGVRHRDLKPSNILLDGAGRPLLLDFNLSEDERLDSKRIGGTLPYMAPEQLQRLLSLEDGDTEPDGRDDLFALGVILYELLTGHHPFGNLPLKLAPRVTAELLLERHQAGCTPLRTFNPQVDRRLATLIESCLAFEPNDRPASAAAFAAVLKRRFAPSRRLRLVACFVGVLVLATSGGSVWALSSALPGTQPPSAFSTAPRATPVEEYEAGCKAYAERRYADADDAFERALKGDRENVSFQFARGRSLLALDDGIAARNYFAQALSKQPRSPQILTAKAYSELLIGTPGPAIMHLDEAEKQGFTSKELYADRAYARLRYQKDDSFDKAIADCNSALAIDPQYLPAHYNHAMAEFQKWQLLRQTSPTLAFAPTVATEIELVIELAKKDPQNELAYLYKGAADIYGALAASSETEEAAKGRYYFELAVTGKTGFSKTRLSHGPFLKRFIGKQDQEWFKSLPDRKETAKFDTCLRMDNPIQDWLK